MWLGQWTGFDEVNSTKEMTGGDDISAPSIKWCWKEISEFSTWTVTRKNFGGSRSEAFCKKGVLWNFVKFTGKNLCRSVPPLNKVEGIIPATLLKKRLQYRFFPVNFATFLRTAFYIEHLWWLLLKLVWKQESTETITTNLGLHLLIILLFGTS